VRDQLERKPDDLVLKAQHREWDFYGALKQIDRSGVGGKERLVRQACSELLDVEGPIETGVNVLAIGETADLTCSERTQYSAAAWGEPAMMTLTMSPTVRGHS